MYVLGIETSCDDTCVAIYGINEGILTNKVFKQKVHSEYGGVIPELAARNHADNIIKILLKTIKESKIKNKNIKGIAYTAGPGMIGSLIVGANIGCSLAYSWKIPVIAINHIEGHLLTPMIEYKKIKFPFLALLVSGGHTQIIFAENIGKYRILGKSLDDSVGDTFDKVAKFLGLKYPGGYTLSKLAKKGKSNRYIFPCPNIDNLSLSFSGLKTHVLKVIKSSDNIEKNKADIAKAFEKAIVRTLIKKCELALELTGLNRLVIAGGVSANYNLRKQASILMNKRKGEIFYAKPELCTDNGAMIAYVGMIRLLNMNKNNKELLNYNIKIYPRWSIENI